MLCVYVLVTVALLSHGRADLATGGPHNVVGYFTENVTLQCNRDAPGGVTWWHLAPGSDREQPVPGRHTYSSSSYGQHSIRLENLQRSDAGLYVCRSSHDPQSFDPASAFVVVVADHPVCRADYTNLDDQSEYTISCRITYNGLLNLSLSIRNSHDDYIIARRNYTSSVRGSWWHLEREVAANSSCQSLKPNICRAQFYSSKTALDVAKNRPVYIEVPCDPLPPRCAAETSARPTAQTAMTATPNVFIQATLDAISIGLGLQSTLGIFVSTDVVNSIPETAAAKDTSSSQAAVWMSAVALSLALAVVVILLVLFFIRRRNRRQQYTLRLQDGQQDIEGEDKQRDLDDVTSEAHDDDTGKVTAKLLNGAASKLSGNSSAGNVNCSVQDMSAHYHADPRGFPEHGRPSDVQPSNSDSVVSLRTCSIASVSLHHDVSAASDDDDDDGESNEKTVIPNTAGKLAEAAAAARLDNND